MSNFYHNKKHKLLFKKTSNEHFIPIMYDVSVNKNGHFRGKLINENAKSALGRAMYDFITFAINSGNQYDTETGEQAKGHAEIYQYIIAFENIKHLILLDSADLMAAIARQAKDYWSV